MVKGKGGMPGPEREDQGYKDYRKKNGLGRMKKTIKMRYQEEQTDEHIFSFQLQD